MNSGVGALDLFREQMNEFFVGKGDTVDNVLCCFLAGGHVLLEDVPGVGKTTLARTFAGSLGLSFGRIQFTPDTMPGDVTGMSVYDMKNGEFKFRPGGVMNNIVLADELNRTSPKTQSALLEAMAEHQVTVDGETHLLAEPSMIMATQNPLESQGTFPLPEAQTDRFFMRLSLGYMERGQELAVLTGADTNEIVASLHPCVTQEETETMKRTVREIEVTDDVAGYLMDIVTATRNDSRIRIGVSTRGALALYKASQAAAALAGRTYVTPEDVKALAPAVLAHRILTVGGGRMSESEAIIAELAETCSVPME